MQSCIHFCLFQTTLIEQFLGNRMASSVHKLCFQITPFDLCRKGPYFWPSPPITLSPLSEPEGFHLPVMRSSRAESCFLRYPFHFSGPLDYVPGFAGHLCPWREGPISLWQWIFFPVMLWLWASSAWLSLTAHSPKSLSNEIQRAGVSMVPGSGEGWGCSHRITGRLLGFQIFTSPLWCVWLHGCLLCC